MFYVNAIVVPRWWMMMKKDENEGGNKQEMSCFSNKTPNILFSVKIIL
jgi:hypothetical protein